ncbi:hypothetical protein BDZ91DRAFT_844132 [Kalaharituber pfeilii]|nr:hypothetical protein BDZ91DRAFT_844132 [Kalaharituber pfeilii]
MSTNALLPQASSPSSNPLISPNPSTSGLKIALHPLALLSISDYITRHTLRGHTGPIVGALLGNQQGREIAIEQAYEVLVHSGKDEKVGINGGEDEIILDEDWFDKKLRLFKDTHPTMDLLGWYSTSAFPNFHPSWKHVTTHRVLQKYNESLILLLLNPYSAAASIGGKLPLGIYESIIEGGDAQPTQPGSSTTTGGILKFVPAEYTIETGEAEMIGVDFVAKGGWGNATAVSSGVEAAKAKAVQAAPTQAASAGGDTVVGEEAAMKEEKSEDVQVALASEFAGTQNDELIANLTAKANAIRMLHSRICLLKKYLESLPQSQSPSKPSSETLPVSHPLLRAIKSLTNSRLPLLIPSDYAAFQQEALAEQSDVALVALLGTLTRSVEELKEVGRRFQIVDTAAQREGPSNRERDLGMSEGRGRKESIGGGGSLGGALAEKFMDMGRMMRGVGSRAS